LVIKDRAIVHCSAPSRCLHPIIWLPQIRNS